MVGFDPQNPDFGSTVQESFGRLTFMRTIGATLERVSPGDVDIALPFRDASGRRRSQPSEGTASVTEMNCEVDLEQELIAAHTRTNLMSWRTNPDQHTHGTSSRSSDCQ